MFSEFGQAVLVNVAQSGWGRCWSANCSKHGCPSTALVYFPTTYILLCPVRASGEKKDVHACSASCDFATLLQAIDFALSIGIGLAHHVVVIVRLASGANEEGCGQKRSRGSTNLRDLGNVLGEGSCVDEDLLVESVDILSEHIQYTALRKSIPGLPGRHLECVLVKRDYRWSVMRAGV